ncbi:hypothetical protein BGZ63DRAFT_392043 [Mariannaea sp. PMI_226]|nr:hypothetical protein BGZ63DRAFT_392043 [Mariannaea sp. PMI_226]
MARVSIYFVLLVKRLRSRFWVSVICHERARSGSASAGEEGAYDRETTERKSVGTLDQCKAVIELRKQMRRLWVAFFVVLGRRLVPAPRNISVRRK